VKDFDIYEIVTEEKLNKAYANSNFGDMTKREVLALSVLKCACGFYQGHTSRCISVELYLIDGKYRLTEKGQMYLWAAWSTDINF